MPPADSVRVWDCATLKEQRTLRGQPGIISLATSAEGVIATGGGQGHLALWDLDGGMLKGEFSTGSAGITALDFSPDGKKIAVGNADGGLSVWQTEGNAIWTIEHAHAGLINSVAFSPDGKSVASVGWGGWRESGMWLMGNQVCLSPSALAAVSSESSSHHPTDRYWPWAASFSGIRLWNLQRPQEAPREIQTPTNALLFSPDGALLFSGGNDGLIKVGMLSRLISVVP